MDRSLFWLSLGLAARLSQFTDFINHKISRKRLPEKRNWTFLYKITCKCGTKNLWLAYKPFHYLDFFLLCYYFCVFFYVLQLLLTFSIFMIWHSKCLPPFLDRSKYSGFLFLLSVNVFSAQLWADTCKKFSPIEYMECTLLRYANLLIL